MKNRIANCGNKFQGQNKKVLCVCSAGLLRSPTAAWVLSNKPYEFNTRCAGCVDEYALIRVEEVLLHWADEIVCMEKAHLDVIEVRMKQFKCEKPILCLNIPDSFEYRDSELCGLISKSYDSITLYDSPNQ